MRSVVIAADPGTARSALVVVAPSTRGRVVVLRSEMVDATCVAMGAFLDTTLEEYGHVVTLAIEWASGFAYQPFRVPHLLAAQGVAGELSGLAYEREIHVTKASANHWRAAVVGKLPRPPKLPRIKNVKPLTYDALIARALPSFVDGLGISNVHERDAIGLGVWASRKAFRWSP